MASRVKKKNKPGDLNLLPVMALFSILIPFLISVASFQKLGIVDVNLPKRSDVPNPDEETPPPDDQAINLTVAIAADSEKGEQYLQIVARGGMLPMIFYSEMWKFRCKSNGDTITYAPSKVIKGDEVEADCPDGTKANQYDIDDIMVWTIQKETEDDAGKLRFALYSKNDSVYVDGNNNFLEDKADFQPGKVFATLKESSNRKIDAEMAREVKRFPLSAYDALAKELIGIHNRFIDAPDAEQIIILANDDVAFDKVIKVMDRARDAGFYKISLAKLAG
jgi:biopolymer transport protein ExbD